MQQLYTIIYLIVIFAVFYFFIIRPQQVKQKEHNNLIAGVAVGDEVVTAGGIYGTVKKVLNEAVMLEVSANVEVKVAKNSIIMKERTANIA